MYKGEFQRAAKRRPIREARCWPEPHTTSGVLSCRWAGVLLPQVLPIPPLRKPPANYRVRSDIEQVRGLGLAILEHLTHQGQSQLAPTECASKSRLHRITGQSAGEFSMFHFCLHACCGNFVGIMQCMASFRIVLRPSLRVRRSCLRRSLNCRAWCWKPVEVALVCCRSVRSFAGKAGSTRIRGLEWATRPRACPACPRR